MKLLEGIKKLLSLKKISHLMTIGDLVGQQAI
jgi:hypothetical protein